VDSQLRESYQFCYRLTRQAAKNFYFSFLTLPLAKRESMCAIYAWMRRLDDLADDAPSPEQARVALDQWKALTHAVYASNGSLPHADLSKELWPAFADTVQRYGIPQHYFDEIVEGALMDQTVTRYATFEELYRYCYRVASVVGLVCLRVFEYRDPEAEKAGEWLGIAFQLTNILRDVPEDAQRGRLYIPQEDFQGTGVSEEDFLQGRWSPAMHSVLKKFAERTEDYYVKAKPVVGLVSKEAQPTLRIMTEIYHGILEQTRKLDYRVYETRARVPTWKKLAIVLKHQLIKS
jgi:15-cis-phytoene synthase